jgi:predicted TIM-barrel fold metal-dependent hydrolase
VGDQLAQAVVREEQWLALVLGPEAVPATPLSRPQPLIDAHSHLVDGGAAALARALDRHRLTWMVLAPLPADRTLKYVDVGEANQRVLRFAGEHPGRIVPLVMVSPLDPDPLPRLEREIAQGARGVKLMSGHGEYFTSSGQDVLDPPAMRKVFAFCQAKGLPVLWHVNTHLYAKGFTRVLADYPRLRVVNPHLGGYLSYAPGLLRGLLEAHPNLYIDLSFGENIAYLRRAVDDLALEPEAWRKLFVDFPERFLFGVDIVYSPSTSPAHADSVYDIYLGLVAGKTFDFAYVPNHGFTHVYEDSQQRFGLTGLDLPPDVLGKLLAGNAERIYGRPRTR